MRDTFIRALTGLAEKDPKIFLMTGDLGFGFLQDFAGRFPRQFLNAGVAEQNMMSLAAGMALEGRRVFAYSIGNFPTLRCLEQIRNDICYHKANVKIVAGGGGLSYGSLGISHHATEDLAIMRSLPEMTVIAAGDLWEAEEAAKELVQTTGPAYLRIDKSCAPPTSRKGEIFQIGRARTVREGKSLTFISTGGILGEVLTACDRLAKTGISCRVLSLHTVKPLDQGAVLKAAEETGGIITVEEHTVEGGLGSAVAEVCLEANVIPLFFHRIGLRSGFSSQVGSQSYLRKHYGLDAAALARAAADFSEQVRKSCEKEFLSEFRLK